MILELLKISLEYKVSDIILSAWNYPAFKGSGDIVYLKERWKLDAEEIKKDILTIIPERNHD